MAVPTGVNAGEETANSSPRQKLKNLVAEWERLRSDIEKILDNKEQGLPYNEASLRQQRAAREEAVDAINAMVRNHPQLADVAINNGFRADLLTRPGDSGSPTGVNAGEERATGGSGGTTAGGGGSGSGRTSGSTGRGSSGGGGGGGGGDRPKLGEGWRLPGVKGKDYTIVRSPKGTQLAVYKIKVGSNVVKVAVQLPRKDSELSKYGVKKGEGHQLNAAQMKGLQNIGWAEEIGRHFRGDDKNPFQALKRSLKRQYGGQPILEDDEVMGLIIANSVLGWTPGEFENQLRNTKWYRNTNDYQRDYALTQSPKQRKDTFRQYFEQVENHLEDTFGDDWMGKVEGGRAKAREWAEKIASGQWGTPDAGFRYWSERMFDKATDIEGTPAWMQNEDEQEALRQRANRPEEMTEQLRTQAREYLGPQFAPDHDTLLKWATKLVTQKASTEDWMQWLRGQSRQLHPWKDENVAWQDVASSYKGIIENVLRTPVGFNDKLLSKIGGDKKALSAHEFELMVRQDNRAWKEGTALWDEGTAIASQLANAFQGVSF